MWTFEAKYFDMNTKEEVVRRIEFYDKQFKHEEDCYLYAMKKAYEMKQGDEFLDSVSYIEC